MKNKIDIDGMIEAVEILKEAQIELDEVIQKIRDAVRDTPVGGTFHAYTLPSLSMISHLEDHQFMGREMGNLDDLMRELNEITEEQIALRDEGKSSEEIEREDIGDAELDLEGDDDPEVRRGRESGCHSVEKDADDVIEVEVPDVIKGYHPKEELIHQPLVYTGAGVEIKNPLYIDSIENRKVGEQLVEWDGAPGCGRHVYLITRMDGSGVYGIKQGEAGEEGPDPTDVNPSRQVKIHNQPDRVRDVLTAFTDDELTMLRVACRPFDGHPGVDSKTIIFYKPDFLALALLKSVEDHVGLNDGGGERKGMTAKGLNLAFEILSKFERAEMGDVTLEDLAHVEMEMHDEMGREAYKADRKVIEGGAE